MSKADDTDFEEYEIEEVHLLHVDGGRAWKCMLQYGFEITWPRVRGKPQPKKGQTVRAYGDIDSGDVRGIDLDGKELYYRTEDEHEQMLKDQQREAYETRKPGFDERRAEVIKLLEAMTPAVQRRIGVARHAFEGDPDMFDVLHLEQLLHAYGTAERLAIVTEDQTALGIFASLSSQSKMDSVYRQMIDDHCQMLRDEGGDDGWKIIERLDGTGFMPASRVLWSDDMLSELLDTVHELLAPQVSLVQGDGDAHPLRVVTGPDDLLSLPGEETPT